MGKWQLQAEGVICALLTVISSQGETVPYKVALHARMTQTYAHGSHAD